MAMKLIMPFWNLDMMDRYFPQINTIAERCDCFTILYLDGEIKKEWEKNINFVKVHLPKVPSYLKWIYGCIDVKNQIKKFDVDAFYCLSGLWFQYYSWYLSKKMKKPYIVRLRGDDRASRINLGQGYLKRSIFGKLYSFTLRRANRIIPISEELYTLALESKIRSDKISNVIYNGIDTNLFNFKSYPDEFIVGYAGRISKEKGSRLLLKITRILRDTKFIVVGELQDNIEFPDNVDYRGILKYSDMPDFYNDCSLIIIPSFNEGFPNTILEAYSTGRTIIININVLSSDIEIYGDLVLTYNIEEWLRSIRSMYLFKDEMEEEGLEARKYVKDNFSWEKYGDEMLKEFTKAIKNK